MKRFWLVVLALFVISAIPGWTKDSGTRFSDLSGQVEVRPDAQEDAWDVAKMGRVLEVNDHIKTGEDSSAILSFSDMTTFVMKPESEIVLDTPPEKDSKVKLLAGNIWVNVKKMVKDGTMEVHMSQAVAGIKGTNITCSSNISEDRIQVLRGLADVLIKETQERVLVGEGQELVVKKGGQSEKIEIDIEKIQKEWAPEVDKMGQSIDLGEISPLLKSITESEVAGIAGIQNAFKALMVATIRTVEEIELVQKNAERYIGVLMEDALLLAGAAKKITGALGDGTIEANQKSVFQSLLKEVAAAQNKNQTYLGEIGKLLKTPLKPLTGAEVQDFEGFSDAIRASENGVTTAFNALQEAFTTLQTAKVRTQEEIDEFNNKVALFVGALSAENQVLYGFQTRIDKALAAGNLPAARKSFLANIMKFLSSIQAQFKKYQAATLQMVLQPINESIAEEVAAIDSSVADAWANVDNIIREVQSNPSGLSQDWFRDSLTQCNDALSQLEPLLVQANALLEKNPSDAAGLALVKKITGYQSQISSYLRDLAVVEIDTNVITEMQQIDDTLSSSMQVLSSEINSYNTTVAGGDAERRLRASLAILNDFSKVRRLYLSAQRLFQSIMASTSGQKFKTSEQAELEETYDRITNTYQQLGIVADELQSRLSDLESQLSGFLK